MKGKKIGIRDVARKAGVSITTVSRALNGYDDVSEKTKERVFKVAEELNYIPDVNARSLGGIAPTVMALLLSGLAEKDDSGFIFELIRSMHNVSLEHNCEFIILTTDTQNQYANSYLNLCDRRNVNGVLIAGLKDDDPYLRELVDSKIPSVLVDVMLQGRNVFSITIDNERASYEAVRYLVELGHKKIAMMNGKESAEVSRIRKKGYLQALRNSGISLDASWIYDGNFIEETAYAKTKIMLEDHPDVTAIFCASDVMAIGVIEALKSFGKRVPEDISVVGFDDMPAARLAYGGITTVKQSFYEMGVMGAEALYQMIVNDQQSSEYVYAPYRLIKRKTTAVLKESRL